MKILAIDIETKPNLVWTWGLRQQDIGVNQIVEPVEMICFAAKWIGKRGVEFRSQWGDGHEAMVRRAHELLDEADVVLHFNGNSFDIPHLYREFVELGLTPPAPFHNIDLYLAVRKRFRFQSNKLDHVAKELGFAGKEETGGFDLWRGVMAGDEVAQRRMRKYNIRDVTVLEELHEKLRPWIPGYPSVPLHDGGCETCCPVCGSSRSQRRGHYNTKVSRFARHQCLDCGKWFRSTSRERGVKVTEVA